MSDNGITLQELSDSVRAKLTTDFDATRKALDDLYNKSGIGDNLEQFRKGLDRQLKAVNETVNAPPVKELVKKPDNFFKKYLIDPIVKTFDKSIIKPIAKEADAKVFKPLSKQLDSKVFKPLSELAIEHFREISKVLLEWFRPIQRSLDSAGQYLRTTLGIVRNVERQVVGSASTITRTASEVTRLAGEAAPLLRVLGKLIGTISKVLPILGLVFDLLSANEIFRAIENQKIALAEIKQQGRDAKASYEILKDLNSKISTLQRDLSRVDQQLQQFNYTSLDIRLSSIEGTLRGISPRGGTNQNVDLSPVQNQLSSIQSQLNRLNTGSQKVDLSSVTNQLTSIQSQIAKIPTTSSGSQKVDLSPLQSQLTSIQSQLQSLPNTINASAQSTTSAIKAQITSIPTVNLSPVQQSLSSITSLLQPLSSIPPTLTRIVTKQSECCLEFHIGNDNILDRVVDALQALRGLQDSVNEVRTEVSQIPSDGSNANFDAEFNELSQKLQQITDQVTAVDKTTVKTFKVLGGNAWYANGDETPNLSINPEHSIKALGNQHYANNAINDIQVSSILGLIQATESASFYRSGLHRLPATMPKKIHLKENEVEETEQINTLLDFQNWQFKQLDSALGYYPLNIKYKDATGTEKLIEIENLSEAISEIVGLLLALDSDTDLISEVLIKDIGETCQNKAQISLAVDYLRAIADFLGFKFETGSKKLPIPVNPRKKSVKGFLEKTEVDIQSVELKEPSDDDIISKLNQLLIITGMTRTALTKKVLPGKIDGDKIKEEIEAGDLDWDQFLQFLNNLPSGLKNPGDNTPKARDRSSYLSPTDQNDG